MADNWMDNGAVLALGGVALLGLAGVARAGWRGEWKGDIDLPFFGAKGGVESQVRLGGGSAGRMDPSRAGFLLETENDPHAGASLANLRWHGDSVYPPTKPRRRGSGSKKTQVTQILDAYGHRGKTRSGYRKKLNALSPDELNYVFTEVMAQG
jgi:hypothetical protein